MVSLVTREGDGRRCASPAGRFMEERKDGPLGLLLLFGLELALEQLGCLSLFALLNPDVPGRLDAGREVGPAEGKGRGSTRAAGQLCPIRELRGRGEPYRVAVLGSFQNCRGRERKSCGQCRSSEPTAGSRHDCSTNLARDAAARRLLERRRCVRGRGQGRGLCRRGGRRGGRGERSSRDGHLDEEE